MSIFSKNILPLMLLALFVLGCDNSQQARPGSSASQIAQAVQSTTEELDQQKKNISEVHNKFRDLLRDSALQKNDPARKDFRGRVVTNGVDRSGENLKTAENFLAKLDTLDASACPADYCKSYNALKDALADFFRLVVKNQGDLKGSRSVTMPASTMGTGDFDKPYDGPNVSDLEYKEAMEKVRTKTKEYSSVALYYGFML